MPIMHLSTNIKDVPDDLELQLCQMVGQMLDKPMEKITLTVHTGVRQLRAGSVKPMVSLDIHSIGVFDKDRNPSYTSKLLHFFQQKLGLPENRVVVIYHDLQPHNLGQKLS